MGREISVTCGSYGHENEQMLIWSNRQTSIGLMGFGKGHKYFYFLNHE